VTTRTDFPSSCPTRVVGVDEQPQPGVFPEGVAQAGFERFDPVLKSVDLFLKISLQPGVPGKVAFKLPACPVELLQLCPKAPVPICSGKAASQPLYEPSQPGSEASPPGP
jgi:hypothetical protein